MKALLIALTLMAGQAWGAYADNTTALYDLENNLSDTAGTLHGTQLTTMAYQTTGAWNGSYCGGGNGDFLIPAATLNAVSGTVEFSIRTGASVPNSSDWISINTTVGGDRTLELYNFGGAIYVYSSAFGINAASYGLSINTNYYLKLTWDAGNIKLYGGSWTTAGTVTLTEKYSGTGTYTSMNGVNGITFMRNPVFPNDPTFYNPGFVDWIRTRTVYDPTTTVTVDPAASANPPAPMTPYQRFRKGNSITPQWWLPTSFLWFLMPSSAHAVIQDGRVQQREANTVFSRVRSVEYAKLVSRFTATPTPNVSKLSPTPTVTPTVTPTTTPPVTPTVTATASERAVVVPHETTTRTR